ncbi:MAG TPA: hypothetical protein VLH81_01550 [Desulfobacterales bacterium]|nr:hypothetical protein [Desulfobacterales bacterium]
MATLTVQQPALAGTAVTYGAAAAGGDSFPNDGRTIVHVKNGGGSSINVTIARSRTCDMGQTHNVVVAVPNGDERIIGPFDRNDFGPSVALAYSGVTSVTVAAVRAGS